MWFVSDETRYCASLYNKNYLSSVVNTSIINSKTGEVNSIPMSELLNMSDKVHGIYNFDDDTILVLNYTIRHILLYELIEFKCVKTTSKYADNSNPIRLDFNFCDFERDIACLNRVENHYQTLTVITYQCIFSYNSFELNGDILNVYVADKYSRMYNIIQFKVKNLAKLAKFITFGGSLCIT